MKDIEVITPSGEVGTIHAVKPDEDWRDRYQWIWGTWPDDSVLVESARG